MNNINVSPFIEIQTAINEFLCKTGKYPIEVEVGVKFWEALMKDIFCPSLFTVCGVEIKVNPRVPPYDFVIIEGEEL